MFLQLLTGLSLYKVALGAFCDQTYNSSSGIVSSPSFSTTSNYDNNLDCQYDIQVDFGSGIELHWTTFDIMGEMPNCYEDYVEIYIGSQRHSVGKYCSDNIGVGDQPFSVYSPDNCLRLMFHSDSSDARTGFEARYYSFALNTGTRFNVGGECLAYSERYPKTLSSSAETIGSPNWPRDYPTLRDCYWRIDVPSQKNIKIAFMDFDLEHDFGCDDDEVKIKGGYSSDSYDGSNTIKDSMCGNKNPFYFTSTKERIWIRFKSNMHSFNANRGFIAGYVMYDTSTSESGGSSAAGIVSGIFVVLVIVGCISFVFVYRRRVARMQQQQQAGVVAHVPVPSQQVNVNVHHPPPPPQPAGYAPPPHQSYAAAPQQGNVPPPQPGYAPPPQQGYAHPPQQSYAPASQQSYAPAPQQSFAPVPQQGHAPRSQPGYVPPHQTGYVNVPPHQPDYVSPPPPYSQVAGTPYQRQAPPYPPGQAEGMPPYPPEQPSPGGAAPYPSAPPPSETALYPPK
ncbi:tolloid-like protein 2 [Oculina patagonica]